MASNPRGVYRIRQWRNRYICFGCGTTREFTQACPEGYEPELMVECSCYTCGARVPLTGLKEIEPYVPRTEPGGSS